MTSRERLSATVEAELLAAARTAVSEGRADSLSGWVNEALRRQADHEILTCDPEDLRELARAAGTHVELVRV